MEGYGFGLIGNIVVGIVGGLHCRLALAAHWVCFDRVGPSPATLAFVDISPAPG
jgi:hypothetical protein